MITDNEKFIEIQGILTLSDISSNDCIKINNLIIELSKEIHQLTKQLETYEIEGYKQEEELDKMSFDIRKYKTQQKEFILYLRHLSNWYSADGVKQGMVNEILQKYKEIIGEAE